MLLYLSLSLCLSRNVSHGARVPFFLSAGSCRVAVAVGITLCVSPPFFAKTAPFRVVQLGAFVESDQEDAGERDPAFHCAPGAVPSKTDAFACGALPPSQPLEGRPKPLAVAGALLRRPGRWRAVSHCLCLVCSHRLRG